MKKDKEGKKGKVEREVTKMVMGSRMKERGKRKGEWKMETVGSGTRKGKE